MKPCKCGHGPDDHVQDDDFSCCVGTLVDSTLLPVTNRGPLATLYEPCYCKEYVQAEKGVLVH